MKRLLRWLVVFAFVGAAVGLYLTRPHLLAEDALAGLTGDAAKGAVLFAAAGCASCHIAPGTEPSDTPVLSGGQRFVSAFGTFIAPNISPDPIAGIGAWSDQDLVQAVTRGVSPEGQHYYPAFPYASYQNATLGDVLDIVAYLRLLPADPTPSQPHEVGFPFNIRRALGGWKLLFMRPGWVLPGPLSPQEERGRYLVESLGHCAECHTPRNLLGGLKRAAWLTGAPHPSGQGSIPNITPDALGWAGFEISYYLETGFTPEFDTAGGEMAEVVLNTSQLAADDRDAIAAYLLALPALGDE
ncbi:MAG: cytochrome c [Rhodobacteraceae bacterium]|nr:cytochrome c [Paracoccaceae bacterium]